jgi:CMP-N-acetylneuraminic acid synthetase
VKLAQLDASRRIDEIIVSSNDEEVLGIAQRFAVTSRKPVRVERRAEELSLATTSIADLSMHAADLAGDDNIVVWAHVTSPLVRAEDYDSMIEAYEAGVAAGTHDSLMTVTVIRKFLWSEDGPFNYRTTPLKWPRTQDLPPIYEVNSASFIADAETCRRNYDRVGTSILRYEMDEWRAVDVDWEHDFQMAEVLYRHVSAEGWPE